MLSGIERRAAKLAWANHRKRTDAEIAEQEGVALAVMSHQARRERLADITAEQLLKAAAQHSEHFTPLQIMLDRLSQVLLEARDRHFSSASGELPKVVTAYHYETPYVEGGPNLYHASLAMIPKPKYEFPNQIAWIVYAIARQNSPTQTKGFLWMGPKKSVPGRIAYSLSAYPRMIDGHDEPAAREFIERYKNAKEDLELITPDHDLFQPGDDGTVQCSSEWVDHLTIYHLVGAGRRFYPAQGDYTEADEYFRQALAEQLASRIQIQLPKTQTLLEE